MDLFNNLENTPETNEEDILLQPKQPLEKPIKEPENTDELMLTARYSSEAVEKEEAGGRIGNPVEFAEQFNNTIIAAATAPVDLMTWALNKASNAVAGKDLIDPETVVGGSKSTKAALDKVGIGSDEAPDSYLGYAGQTFGEATAFLAGGAAVVQKTKQASGVVGALSKQADDALKNKLGSVVAAEAVVSAGMAGGRQIAVENEFGTTGALATEFATGALSMVAGGGAIGLAKKLKNMTYKESLEKLSKEEIAEVAAEGQRVIAKEEPTPKVEPEAPATPKETPEPTPAFKEDIPTEQWLNDKIEEVVDRGTNTAGSPSLESTTGFFEDLKPIKLPLETTKNVEGYNGEHLRLDRAKVDKFAKELEADGKFEYPPLIGIAYNGKPYIIEGNHRIAASQQAGIPIDIEVKYYDGGQRKAVDGWKPEQLKESPAPKTPEATPKADPIDEAIESIDSILTGDRTGGKGARVTRQAKRLFRSVTREFFGDITDLIKTKDVASAKKILARIDKYTEFDRKISQKDYAQGSELQANTRQAMDNGTTDYTAGISAAANKRTQDLQVLKGMLQKFVDEDATLDTKVLKGAAKDAQKKSEGAPKLSKEEKLDAIADQVAKTFVEKRAGVFQQTMDAYFTVRLTQMLNQAKTAFVGVPSATMMGVVRPIINTPYNIVKSLKLKDASVGRRLQYASADIAGTYEYARMLTKHLKDTLRSSKDTILNRGDSNFLYRDRNAYIKDQLAEATEAPYRVKKRLKQAQRREDARNAETALGRKVLNAKATVMNSKLAQAPAFFFDYGVSLIGGLEDISLIAHSMRAARAAGIKKGIDDGVDDVWKFSEEYMEGALDRSRGTLQAKYDPEYADIFNQARRDHFRAMDLDPNDIRKDMIDGIVGALSKTSMEHSEMGYIARTLFVFIGVPMRALGMSASFIGSPVNVAKNVAGGAARKAEMALGGTATFGKYNKKISELEIDIKEQRSLLKSEASDVAETASKKLAELENDLARVKDLKMQKDYEDLGKLAIGSGLFFLGYEMAKNGQVAGTDSWMTEEQKLAAQKVQGAPNSWKMVMGGNEFDFRYFDPLKGVFALGADVARREAAKEAGALTEDQTMIQFVTSVSTSIATDSPFATGARYVMQIMSPNPETQTRGLMGVVRSMIPVPAEVRNFNKFDEEFVTDTTAGTFLETTLAASMGKETGNYRMTSLGEPKMKEEPSLISYILPFGPKKVPEREPIDDILLEDAMSYRSVSDVQTSVSGLKLKNYVNDENEDLYSVYGRLISTERINGKTLRQELNKLVKSAQFKKLYKEGYVMNDQGTEENAGVEMIKDIISEYKANAREKLLNTKAGTDYVDGDGNNIYDILKEREGFSERPEGLLESLNIEQ